MFERYNEKARRVIFFARYEASQYGCRQIETEHILLAVMREGHSLMRQLLGPNMDGKEIRAEIEKVIAKGVRFPTSTEVPLSEESKKVLQFAFEEAKGPGTPVVTIEHILIGMLRVDGSVAARILNERGVQLEKIRERVATLSSSAPAHLKLRTKGEAVDELNRFLAHLKSKDLAGSVLPFAKDAQIVDSEGQRWKGREEIEKESARLFVAYAERNITPHLESFHVGPGHSFIAGVLWENVSAEGKPSNSAHRMTIILTQEDDIWVVFFLQVTPVAAPGQAD